MILSLLDFPEVLSLRGLVKLYKNLIESKTKQSIRYRLDSVKTGGKIKFFARNRPLSFAVDNWLLDSF